MTKDEALKMAIECLQFVEEYDNYGINVAKPVIQACKEALEQPAQEPIHNCPNCNSLFTKEIHSIPAPSWQGLSDDEIFEIDKSIDPKISIGIGKTLFARAIEQAIKEKNPNLSGH